MCLQLEITSQLLDLAGEMKQVQWNNFLERMLSYIVDSYDGNNKTTYRSDWKKKFKDFSKKLGLIIVRDEEQVDIWAEKITLCLVKDTSSKSSHTSSTSLLSYQRLLTENDENLISSVYKKNQ